MNPHFPTLKGGHHRAARVLFLLLLQHALVPAVSIALTRSRLPNNPETDPSTYEESRPYLKVAGSLPLRFAAAPRPLPSLPAKIPVAAVSTPSTTLPTTEPTPNPAPATSGLELKNPPVEQSAVSAPPANGKPALSILPDDTHPSTRAEDFLPFFQFPAGGNVTVVVPASVAKPPAPGQQPVSSATYQQR